MTWPKIIYPTTSEQTSGSTTLTFKWPPLNMSDYVPEVVGAEDYSSHGIHLAVLERVDQYLEFDMPFISEGVDSAAWEAFMAWAAGGGDFDFYPDASLTGFTTYHWPRPLPKVAHKAPGLFQMNGIKFRMSILS